VNLSSTPSWLPGPVACALEQKLIVMMLVDDAERQRQSLVLRGRRRLALGIDRGTIVFFGLILVICWPFTMPRRREGAVASRLRPANTKLHIAALRAKSPFAWHGLSRLKWPFKRLFHRPERTQAVQTATVARAIHQARTRRRLGFQRAARVWVADHVA